MDEEIPSTSSEIKTDSKSYKRCCTVKEKDFVADNIKSSEFQRFARFLGLQESKIDALETDCKRNNYGFRETVYQMLVKWEQIKGCEATVEVLISALNSIQRNDIVQHLFPDYYHRNQQPMNEHLQEMQQKQKKKYRHLMLPRTLWLTKKRFTLEEFYVELTMKKKDKWGREEDINIEREEIFHEIEIEENIKNNHEKLDSPRRVLIEGHPGYGKTTLISKLLFDWSREEKYLRDKFDLVFVIALRNFKGNLENHLLQQIKNVNGSDEDKLETIREVEGRVLLLLDGLDECNERVKDSLVPLFNGDQYPHMTVLVTSRTGFIHFQQEPDDNFEIMGITGFEYHLIWNKRIQIKGISPEKRLEFLQKRLNINSNDLKRKFQQFNFKNNNLYECPLFLLLFAVFAQEGQKLETIQTKTELYKRMFNFVLNRNLNRENLLKEEFDMFDDKVEDKFGCRNFLSKFGQLCLEKLKKQSLTFEERELLECSGGDEIILKLGFVSKELNFDNDEEEEHYEPIHKSFLEFLAAFYLSFLNEAELKREVKEMALKFNLWPEGDKLLYSFLGGLLNENAYKLFNSFSPFNCLFTIFQKIVAYDTFYDLDEILKEIPENDDIYNSLIPFVPANWKTFVSPSSPVITRWYNGFLDFVKRKEITNNIFLGIPDNLDCFKDSSIQVNTVEVDVNIFKKYTNILLTKEIKCRNLVLCCKNIKNDFIDGLKLALSKIKVENIFLLFDSSWSLEEKLEIFTFCELIRREDFQNFIIHNLKVKIKKPDLANKVLILIEDLIERKKIETGIDIECYSEDFNRHEVEEMNSFLDFVFKSHLIAVVLKNMGNKTITIKFNKKQWKYIKLSGNFKNINTSEISSISVEHLDIRDLYVTYNHLKWLGKCTGLKRLQCKARFLSELNEANFADWFGFETLVFLDMYQEAEDLEDYSDEDWDTKDSDIKDSDITYFIPLKYFKTYLTVISRFKNLQEIHIPIGSQEHLVELLSSVPPLKKICLCNTDLYFYYSALKFLEKELSVMNEKLEIELRIDESRSDVAMEKLSSNEFFEVLEKCCLKNIFVCFSFLVPELFYETYKLMNGFFKMRHSMCNYFLFREGFKICFTWEEDRYCVFEVPKLKIKMSIIYEFPGKSLSLK